MKKIVQIKVLMLMLLFLLSIISVNALTVTLDKSPPDYIHGNIIAVMVQCSGSSSLSFSNPPLPGVPVGSQIYFTLREGLSTVTYNTNSDSANGKYRVDVLCTDGQSQSVSFCVDQNGCTATAPPPQEPAPSSGGGGGRRCVSEWVCGTWGTCDAAGQQTRTCTDVKCRRPSRIETQACACRESWICSSWSSCQANSQYRTCTDENNCGAFSSKPAESQYCVTPGGGFQQVVDYVPPQYFPPPSVELPFYLKIWSGIKLYWLWILLPIVLVGIALLLYFLFHKKKTKTYNFDELLNWIREERKMGTSDEDVRQILSDKTGWTNEEITHAFNLLETPSAEGGEETQ